MLEGAAAATFAVGLSEAPAAGEIVVVTLDADPVTLAVGPAEYGARRRSLATAQERVQRERIRLDAEFSSSAPV